MFFPKYKYYFLGFLVSLALLAWWAVWETENGGEFRVIFFNVGQGDSIFIEDEGGHQILIDGGQGKSVLTKLGRELPFFDRSLDLVILTHPDKDHLEGLLEVLKRYKVEQVFYTGVRDPDPAYQKFQEIIQTKKISIAFPHYGQRVKLAGNAYLDFLWPLTAISGEETEKVNNTSLVCRLVDAEEEYLFTGDLEKEGEEEILQQNIYLESDILKVGHHGSKNSSTENFLKAVDPEIAVISVGENNYGHPHKATLERLEKMGVQVLRTDQKGDIEY